MSGKLKAYDIFDLRDMARKRVYLHFADPQLRIPRWRAPCCAR